MYKRQLEEGDDEVAVEGALPAGDGDPPNKGHPLLDFGQHLLHREQPHLGGGEVGADLDAGVAVSYTHLDVYKRQVLQMEKMRNQHYDIVITLQPTSPVLRAQTLEKALQAFIEDAADTYISAVNKPHLSWSKSDKGYYPLYKERLNRQQLPPNYLEAGAFFITRREFITENSRMGSQISVYEIPEQEAVDIDTANDWIVCEAILGRKKIVLRADGHQTLGMGHIYHCLTLAYNLIGHEVMSVSYTHLDVYKRQLHGRKNAVQFYKEMKEINIRLAVAVRKKFVLFWLLNHFKNRKSLYLKIKQATKIKQ